MYAHYTTRAQLYLNGIGDFMKRQKFVKYNDDMLTQFISILDIDETIKENIQYDTSEVSILDYLLEHDELHAAVTFLLLGLPVREAVWCGYVCVDAHVSDNNDDTSEMLMNHIHHWVYTQEVDTPQYFKNLAQELGLKDPVAWLAMAAYWCVANISPPNEIKVTASHTMIVQAIVNALSITAKQCANTTQELKLFLRQGIHIAQGGNGLIRNIEDNEG